MARESRVGRQRQVASSTGRVSLRNDAAALCVGCAQRNLEISHVPRRKSIAYPVVLTDHVFDKIRAVDLTFAEFEALLDTGWRGR